MENKSTAFTNRNFNTIINFFTQKVKASNKNDKPKNAIKDKMYAIGFFGFAYYKENSEAVSPVAIADGDDYFEVASFANVANYPMARPLHIYTNGVPESGHVINDYLQYVLSKEGQDVVPEVGYVRLSLVDENLITDQLAKL